MKERERNCRQFAASEHEDLRNEGLVGRTLTSTGVSRKVFHAGMTTEKFEARLIIQGTDRISKMRTPAIPTSRSRNVTTGIFLPTVNRADVDPSGIYCAPRNYSRVGKHLDSEFVDRYVARHSFVIVSRVWARYETALRYRQKCTNAMYSRDKRDHKPNHIKRASVRKIRSE